MNNFTILGTSVVGYTNGLECRTARGIKSVMVEYSRHPDGGIKLQAVSARNLSRLRSVPAMTISREEFDDRPRDPYDSIKQAIWALEQVGIAPAAI